MIPSGGGAATGSECERLGYHVCGPAATGSGLTPERDTTVQGTHWEGCWREHNECAWARAEDYDRLRADQERLMEALHFVMDEAVERWHEPEWKRRDRELVKDWLGLTDDEYAAWVEGRYGDFVASIAARRSLVAGTDSGGDQ